MTTPLNILQEGPFPSHIDPWIEQGRYFHQLHGHMITYLLDQLSEPLFQLGYGVGCELSLLIAENRQPDLFVEEERPHPKSLPKYAETAAQLELEAGVKLAKPIPDLDHLIITELNSASLVTIIEIISPNNKTKQKEIYDYQQRRDKLLETGIHIVEIDLTRSSKRLLEDNITEHYPYHIAIYPYNEDPYFIGIKLRESPKSFALPLRGEPLAVELNLIYREAYKKLMLARQVQKEEAYSKKSLPFPSTLSSAEQAYLMNAVKTWQGKL